MEIRLILTVSYNAKREDEKYLKDNLRTMVERAIGEGLLTGESDMTVHAWELDVETTHMPYPPIP